MSSKDFIYLDHAASTPVAPEVIEAMLPYFSEIYGNPSGLHQQARASKRGLTQARKRVANILHCQPKEIIFTSGGSESDNMAVRGVAWAQQLAGKGNHLITSPIEHSAVQKTINQLCQNHGFRQTIVPVDATGMVNPAEVEAAIQADTILITIMAANNEVGTLQPLAEIGTIAKKHNVLFHSDTVQAIGFMPFNMQTLNLDILTMSAHKFYGPKGVGVLYMRQGVPFTPSSTGGSHEENRRPGTENVASIVGLATALELAYDQREAHTAHLTGLRDKLIAGVLNTIPKAQLTGHPTKRLPHHASFVFANCDASALLMHLDTHGIGGASGSACDTGMPEPSGVLLAMGIEPSLALGALRLTLGRSTTEADLDYVLEILPQAVETVRQLHQTQQALA